MSSTKRRKTKSRRPLKSAGSSLTDSVSASNTKGAGMKRKFAALVAGGLVAACALAPTAQAQLDPYVPDPPLWCPGNGPEISASGCGGVLG
jgi:hypothetical protein